MSDDLTVPEGIYAISEQVHQGLEKCVGLAEGVGDLKKVLSGVKTRGIVGEIQLGALKRHSSPEQYEENVATVSGSTRAC